MPTPNLNHDIKVLARRQDSPRKLKIIERYHMADFSGLGSRLPLETRSNALNGSTRMPSTKHYHGRPPQQPPANTADSNSILAQKQLLLELTLQLTSARTRNSSHHLEVCKLEDSVRDLRREQQENTASVASLKACEAELLQALDNLLAVRKKEIDVDLHERLHLMKETVCAEVAERLAQQKAARVARREETASAIAAAHAEAQSHAADANRTLIRMKEDQHRRMAQLRAEMDALVADLESSTQAVAAETARARQQLADLTVDQLAQTELHDIQLEAAQKRLALDELRRTVKRTRLDTAAALARAQAEQKRARDCVLRTRSLQALGPALETRRRRLHNVLQNKKGKIRVFCRVRAVLEPGADYADIHVSPDLTNQGKQEVTLAGPPSLSPRKGASVLGNRRRFAFDKIFGPDSANHEIFLEISQLVQLVLDGYNVCVFAYGQTGSGKTYTMSGANGMIPLLVGQVFAEIALLAKSGWRHTVKAQMVEIYNELVFDLLGDRRSKVDIKHNDLAKTTEVGCTAVVCDLESHTLSVLAAATRKRATAATAANVLSLRLHFAFLLEVSGRHLLGKVRRSVLNLVDLAGSERLASSQVKGDRLKETQAINKSLLSLGDVIYSLGVGGHVPYRNSKLTYLLKHSLGGDLKTLMFVNVSPLARNLAETLNSLRFAAKVNETKSV